MNEEAKLKITKARVSLQKDQPFLSYLIMHLIPKEDIRVKTAGVDEDGYLYYNPDFINNLSNRELIGTMAHEVLHLCLEHLRRRGGRNPTLWNIATDIAVNYIVIDDLKFNLPENTFKPNHYGKIDLFGITQVSFKNKPAEEIYEELLKLLKEHVGKKSISSYQFDKHIEEKQGASARGKEGNRKPPDWKKIFAEAIEYAKQRGELPGGIERLFSELHNPKLPWNILLAKYISKTLPVDYTYIRPSKKSYTLKTYLPSVLKENLDVIVTIDTSGSITEDTLTDFLSELLGILRSYKTNLTVIYGDAKVQKVKEFKAYSQPHEILREAPVGGGGTDHEPIFKYIEQNLRKARVVVAFTDGYTNYPKNCSIPTIWVLSEKINKEFLPPFGEVIYYDRR